MSADLRRPARTYTIRQLCEEFGCTPRALRFYEDKGLLAPRRDGLNRIYSHRERGRLQLILRGKRVGLSLADIREMLDLYELDDGGVQQAARSIGKFRDQLAVLEQQRVDLDASIAALNEAIALLEGKLAGARPDLLPSASDYDQELRRRLDGAEA
jgi:DNA-binding transcriptional MerR regulator